MSAEADTPDIKTELQLRVTLSAETDGFAGILRMLSASAGAVRGHFAYRLRDVAVGLFLCECPEEGASALQSEGIAVETEAVVSVLGPDRPGMLRHILQTLKAENVDVSYSYSASSGSDHLVVLCTNDNPKAEDVLRNFLLLYDPGAPETRMDRAANPYPTNLSS